MARVRNVHGGTEKCTAVVTVDNRDRKSGAYHEYRIDLRRTAGIYKSVAEISFHRGPLGEAGPNGCFIEDLLAIVADRLECLQKGKFSCVKNAQALACVHGALLYLDERTRDRKARGVEGKNKA